MKTLIGFYKLYVTFRLMFNCYHYLNLIVSQSRSAYKSIKNVIPFNLYETVKINYPKLEKSRPLQNIIQHCIVQTLSKWS